MNSPITERIAVLEVLSAQGAKAVERLDLKVDSVENKIDRLLAIEDERERRRTAPKQGVLIGRAAQRTLGGIIGAVVLYVAAALGLPVPHVDATIEVPTKSEPERPTESPK